MEKFRISKNACFAERPRAKSPDARPTMCLVCLVADLWIVLRGQNMVFSCDSFPVHIQMSIDSRVSLEFVHHIATNEDGRLLLLDETCETL